MASSMLTAEMSVSGPKEAEMDKAASHACANDPDFAVICDFLQKFSKDLGIDLPNFKLLLQWLTKSDEVSPQLRDMQIKLLRKTRKTVHEKSWESALSKFCFTYSAQDGWEIERFGYKNASAKVKLRILRELLECQFERNTKFRSKILTLSADTLRSKPIGRDRQGHSYWVTKDNDCNICIYQEHLDEEIWQVVATNRDEFVHLLKLLKASEVIQPCEDIDKVDEDTTSSSSNIDSDSVQKVLPPEEKSDSQEDEQKVPKLSIKIAFGRNSKDTLCEKDLGKGEEELAADEDAKLLQKSNLSAAVESEEEEFEEIEEESDDESDSEAESEDAIIKEPKTLNYNVTEQKLQKVSQSEDTNKKVEPLLISQKKIIKNETNSTSLNNGKKRTFDEKDSVSSLKNDVSKKLRPSLLHYMHSKSSDKNEESGKVDRSKESCEESDDVDEEIEEEDIDSVAAEEDENEEKMFEDYDDEDVEEGVVGGEITDPIVKVVGEGSGRECNVGNYLHFIEYDSDDFISPILGDIIVEDVQYVYGEGSGKSCLVGNKNSEDDKVNVEKVHFKPSVEGTEINSESQSEMSIPKKGINNTDNKLNKSANAVPNKDNTKSIKEQNRNDEEILDKNINNSSENGKDDAKQRVSLQGIKDINGEKLSEDTTTEAELNVNSKTDHENENLTANKKPDDEKLLETSCMKDSQLTRQDAKRSTLKSTSPESSGQHTHASKMSALESVKKELRESKQKLLEKKLPQANESCNVKPSSKSIYNRKRRFSNQIQTAAVQRPPNSESEIDFNSENYEDFTNDKDIEIGESDQDIGGKRIKMRPKQVKTELRKKIEAQKVAEKEETTSSSGGEEELRKQRKMVCSKQSLTLESTNLEKSEFVEELPDSVKEDIKPRCTALNKKIEQTKNTKVKPTLAEIIEKKLKKTPEKCQSAATSTDKVLEFNIVKNILPSPKKSPITKPLKKNVLSQIRQEANDDEVPRKRCNSEETVENYKKSAGTSPKPGEEKATSPKPNTEKQKNTLEKQRKRRSSEEIVQNEKPEEPETKKEVTTVEEKLTLKRDKPNDSIKVEAAKGELKDLFSQEEISQPVSGRRSGRRGGIIQKCADPSLPKRNRSSAKISKEYTECKQIETENKNTESKDHFSDPDPDTNKDITNILKKNYATSTSKENETKDVKIKINTNLVEKSANVEGANSKFNLTPKTPTRGTRKQREVDATNIIDVDSETPVRQSRRIAQQKIREEAERRKLEEIALRTMKQELKKKKKAEKEADPTIAPPTEPSSESEESDVGIKRKLQKKKLPGKNGNWSSGSEEQEEPEEEDEEPHRYETDPGSPLFKSDHEFSPESDIEDESQVVPMKRARTVRKEDADGDGTTIYEEEEACQKCNKSDHPEWILLCDNCDKGYHCSCLSPVLFYIPEGEWYCPPCQQEQLIKALEIQLKEFDDLVENKKKLEEDEKRVAEEEKARQEKEEQNKCKTKQDKKINSSRNNHNSSSEDNSQKRDDDDETTSNSDDSKNGNCSRNLKNSNKRYQRDRRLNATRSRRSRLKKHESDSDSGSNQHSAKSNKNVSKSNTSSSSTYSESDDEPIYKLRKRRQINVSYRLNEYDDLINSALKKEMDEVAGAGNLGRGKDISTIIEADKEEKARQKQIEDGEICAIKKEDNDQEKQENSSDTKLNESTNIDKKEEMKKIESDSDAEPIIRKLNIKPSQKKKSRKLTTLDISSEDDDGSDEDFKGSSIDDDDEEDTSVSASNSDSSLEVYKKQGKFKKKRRKAARKAFRERRRNRKFLVDESDDEEIQRPKSKKKRKDDSEYTESEADDDDISDLSENIDSADLCDDTTTDESDGAWRPNKRKKPKKSTNSIAQKTPKTKISHTKKAKKVEYSDDDVSDSDEDEDDDEEAGGSGKGYGKQPRSQPLKKTNAGSSKTKGKGKEKPAVKPRKKKSSEDESSQSNSEDSARRTRGRRYAYIEDFDDDSSDGGIKPGVQRPDTPPEEREKFIKRQEEIKRMLAEKNAEGAKLAATPRLTPIKTENEKDKKSPAKSGLDSLSTVPLSVIRQAKVLDIDYLQRRGENLDDLSTEVGEVDDDFDDADLPDDLPEDMDEDAIARMVEEEEEFGVAAAKELPTTDEISRPSNATKPIKTKEIEKPVLLQNSSTSLSQTNEPITPVTLPTPSSVLQEPVRKRLPMPTIHPPLLRHQYLMHESMPNTHHLMQRHVGPPTSHLLQNALSAPLSQPLGRNFQSPSPHHSLINRMPTGIPLQSTHAISAAPTSHSSSTLINTKPSALSDRAPQEKSTNPQNFSENKPRGRRKKITPLRDTLQKQQTAAAVAAAAATSSALNSSFLKLSETPLSSVIKSGSAQKLQVQPNVLSNMQSTSHAPVSKPGVPMPPIRVPYGADGPRFYDALGGRTQQSGMQRHRVPSQMPPSLLPPQPTNRSSYGPPPPLKGSNSASPVSSSPNASAPIRNPIQHIPPSYLGMPPNARHASQLNIYRAPIYGNPNFGPRSSLRSPNVHSPEFPPGSRAYPPYGFYPPPPPLTTPCQRPVSTSRTSTQIPPVQSNIAHPSTSVIVSSKSLTTSSITSKNAPPLIPEITGSSSSSKLVSVKKEFSIRTSPKPSSPTHVITHTEKVDTVALSAAVPKKKLITLQAYTSSTCKKSPVLQVSDSSGSRSPNNPSARINDDISAVGASEVTPPAEQSISKEGKASEFSGLVSYFSSQHDDYNT